MLQNNTDVSNNRQVYGLIGLSLLVYTTLSILAGQPSAANTSAFITGLIVLFVLGFALFAGAWYLLIKPLPNGLKASTVSPINPVIRQALGIWFVFAGFLGVLGGVWDVAWHSLYGLPFGVDFFWRPHQFIYVALFSPIALAAYIGFQTMKNGKGTLQQRFRADMPLSIIMVAGIFMAFALPADPMWHVLYAEDLSGLSIPHSVFSLVNIVLAIGYLSLLQSYQPKRENWDAAWKLSLLDLPVLSFAAFTVIGLFFTTLGDYEAVKNSASALPHLPAIVAARPVWALPFMAMFVMSWMGTTASYAIKRYGMATMTVVLGAIVRQSLNYVFGNYPEDFSSWFLVLPIALSIDVSLWYAVKRGKAFPIWQQATFLTLVAAIATVPQISLAYVMPAVTLMEMPLVVLSMFVAAFAGIFMGQVVGNGVANTKAPQSATQQETFAPALIRLVLGIFLVALVIGSWFIFTALPPVA